MSLYPQPHQEACLSVICRVKVRNARKSWSRVMWLAYHKLLKCLSSIIWYPSSILPYCLTQYWLLSIACAQHWSQWPNKKTSCSWGAIWCMSVRTRGAQELACFSQPVQLSHVLKWVQEHISWCINLITHMCTRQQAGRGTIGMRYQNELCCWLCVQQASEGKWAGNLDSKSSGVRSNYMV